MKAKSSYFIQQLMSGLESWLNRSWILIVVFVLLFTVQVREALKRDAFYNDYTGIGSVLSGDAGGYYVYLPSLFIYDFNSDKFPALIVESYETSFQLTDKVVCKYPVGTAMAYSPFFLVAHLIAKDSDGFSPPYHIAIRIAAIFYTMFGLLFFFLLSRKISNSLIALIFCFIIFYGSNLWYYTFKAPGYSHATSFFLFSVLLYTLHRNSLKSDGSRWFLPLIVAMIVAVRPINALFLLPLLCWKTEDGVVIWMRIKEWFSNKRFITYAVLSGIIVLMPQLLYNIYVSRLLTGRVYPGEHFDNFFHPQFGVVLWGTRSGLFLYAPLFLTFVILAVIQVFAKNRNAWITIGMFALTTLAYSMWHSPELGCSFSHRGFVDILPILTLPSILIVHRLIQEKKAVLVSIIGVLILCCTTYTKLMAENWWYCSYGQGDFDYDWYVQEVVKYWNR